MSEHAPHAKGIASVLRHRDGHHAKVTFEELFFGFSGTGIKPYNGASSPFWALAL